MQIKFLKNVLKFRSITSVLIVVILFINSIVVSLSFKEQLKLAAFK